MNSKDYARWVNAHAEAVRKEFNQRGRPLTRKELEAYKAPKRIPPIKPPKV